MKHIKQLFYIMLFAFNINIIHAMDIEKAQNPLLEKLKTTVNTSKTLKTKKLLSQLKTLSSKDANIIVSEFRDWLYNEKLDNTPYLKYTSGLLGLDTAMTFISPACGLLLLAALAEDSGLALGILSFFCIGSTGTTLYTKSKITHYLNQAASCAINNFDVNNALIYVENIRRKLNLRTYSKDNVLRLGNKKTDLMPSKELLAQLKTSIDEENISLTHQLVKNIHAYKAPIADKITKDFRDWLYSKRFNSKDTINQVKSSFNSTAGCFAVMMILALGTLISFSQFPSHSGVLSNNGIGPFSGVVICGVGLFITMIMCIKATVKTFEHMKTATNLAHQQYIVDKTLMAIEKIRNLVKIKKLYEQNEQELLALEQK